MALPSYAPALVRLARIGYALLQAASASPRPVGAPAHDKSVQAHHRCRGACSPVLSAGRQPPAPTEHVRVTVLGEAAWGGAHRPLSSVLHAPWRLGCCCRLPPIAVGSAHEFEVNAARATAAAPPPPRRSPHGGPRDAQLAPQSGQKRGREGGEGGGGSQPPQRGGGADNRVAVAGGGAKLESAAAAGQGPPLPAAAVGAAGGGGRPVVSAASALATATLAKIRAGVALPKGGLAQLSALSRAAAAAAAPASAGLPAAAPAAAPRPAPVSAEGAGDEDDDPEPSNLFV